MSLFGKQSWSRAEKDRVEQSQTCPYKTTKIQQLRLQRLSWKRERMTEGQQTNLKATCSQIGNKLKDASLDEVNWYFSKNSRSTNPTLTGLIAQVLKLHRITCSATDKDALVAHLDVVMYPIKPPGRSNLQQRTLSSKKNRTSWRFRALNVRLHLTDQNGQGLQQLKGNR